MTADEAIQYVNLFGSDRPDLSVSRENIYTSQRMMREAPPDSLLFRHHKTILDNEIANVSQAQKEQAYEDAGVDPVLGMAVCDCAPNEPCCMTEGKVADGSDASRHVKWPLAAPPMRVERNLLIVVKEMSGATLSGKVKTSWDGKTCCLGRTLAPHLATRNLKSGPEKIAAKSQEVTVGIPFIPSFATALEQFFPRPIVMSLYVLDMLLTINSAANDNNRAVITPSQCFSDGSMSSALTVQPVPYFKLDGDVTLSTMLRFSTAGVNGSVGIAGSVKLIYGSRNIEGKAEAKSVSGSALTRSQSNQTPGMIGAMASIIAILNEYMGKGNTRGTVRDVSNYASAITLSKSLAFKPRAIEVKAKGGSPDLELKVGGLDLELKIGVTGRLDVIDALAMYFTGPGAAAIRKARAEMAAGKMISGKLEAYLELGAEGTLTHSITSGVTIAIPANTPAPETTSLPEVFRGEIKIRGVLSVGVELGLEVWVFSGKAGVSGTLNTSWTWAVRRHGNERQKKYAFEGLIVELKAHAEATLRRSSSRSSGTVTPPLPEPGAPDDVEGHIAESKAKAELIRNSGVARASGGRTYTLLNAEDSGWQKY